MRPLDQPVRRLPSGLVVPWHNADIGRIAALAEELGAEMLVTPNGIGVGIPPTGTGSGGVTSVTPGSAHLVISPTTGLVVADLSAADKSTLAGLANHYAEYTFSLSLANNSQTTLGSGFTSVHDTDSIGAASGTFTIPAGLTGEWSVSGFVEFPSTQNYNANALIAQLLHNGTAVCTARLQSATAASVQFDLPFAWGPSLATAADTFAISAYQANAGSAAVTVIGRICVGFIGPSTASAGVSGLVPIAKTSAYTALANDWVLCDTTGGTFAVTTPAGPTDGMIFAVTWRAGAAAPTITGTVLGSPTLGAVGNTIWLRYSTITTSWLVV